MFWTLTTRHRRNGPLGIHCPLRGCIEQLEGRRLLSAIPLESTGSHVAITVSSSIEAASTVISPSSDDCGLAFELEPIHGPVASQRTTVARFTTGGSREYASAASTDGSWLTVWADTGSEVPAIFARRIASNGNAMGPERIVASFPAVQGSLRQRVESLNVTSLENHEFVTTWKDREGIHAVLSTASRTNLDFPIDVFEDSFKLHDPDVVSIGDGGFFVAWTSAATNRVRGQKYDRQGTPVGKIVDLVEASASTEIWNLKLRAHPISGFVVQWTAVDYVGTSRYRPTSVNHFYRQFDITGSPVGPPTAIATDSDATRPALAINDNGDTVVVFRRTVDDRVGTYLQWLDTDGSTRRIERVGSVRGTGLEVRPTGQNTLDDRLVVPFQAVSIINLDLSPSAAALSDNGFVITFFDGDAHGTTALARQYNQAGQHIGGARPIASDVRLNRSPLKSIPLANGGFSTTWSQRNRDPAEIALVTQLHASLFDQNKSGDLSSDCRPNRGTDGGILRPPVFNTDIENRGDKNSDVFEQSRRLAGFVTGENLIEVLPDSADETEPTIAKSAPASSPRRRSSVGRHSPDDWYSNIYRAADSAGRALTKQSTDDTVPNKENLEGQTSATASIYSANPLARPTGSGHQPSSGGQLSTVPLGQPVHVVSRSFPAVHAVRQRALLDQAMSHSARALLTPFTSTMIGVATAFDDEMLFKQLDAIQETVMDSDVIPRIVVGTAIVAATGFSAAQFAWMLRGSLLATKLMSTMPIWVSFDPLPVLDSFDDGEAAGGTDEGRDESLADIANPQLDALHK